MNFKTFFKTYWWLIIILLMIGSQVIVSNGLIINKNNFVLVESVNPSSSDGFACFSGDFKIVGERSNIQVDFAKSSFFRVSDGKSPKPKFLYAVYDLNGVQTNFSRWVKFESGDGNAYFGGVPKWS